MPSVIDAPELEIAYVETHDLSIERPQLGRAHPGFWRMLAHKRTRDLHHTPREWHAPLFAYSHYVHNLPPFLMKPPAWDFSYITGIEPSRGDH